MERAAARNTKAEFSIYGDTTHKQVYIYGGLDQKPTILKRGFGMYWGIGGWLLTPFLQRAGKNIVRKLRERVAAEIKTTFASNYTAVISLADAARVDVIRAYNKKATGEKYLLAPQKKPSKM